MSGREPSARSLPLVVGVFRLVDVAAVARVVVVALLSVAVALVGSLVLGPASRFVAEPVLVVLESAP